MTTGPRKEKRPVNPIEAGIMVGRIAVGDLEEQHAEETKPKSVPKRRAGGLKGSYVRGTTLTPKRRSEIAKHAANARWGKTAAKEEEEAVA